MINEHITLLLNTYNLTYKYKYFLFILFLTIIIKESFHWLLLYFSLNIKDNMHLINTYAYILILILIIKTPIENYCNNLRIDLVKDIQIANSNYYYTKLQQFEKTILLNFDLVGYYNTIDHFNEDLDTYFYNIKTKYEVIARMITLLFIAISKQSKLIMALFIVFFIYVKILNNIKSKKEIIELDKGIKENSILRKYIINSKSFLINNNVNNEYINEHIEKLYDISKNISKLNNTLDLKINYGMLLYILIIIYSRFDKLNQFEFYYYFAMVYDIEYISDKITEYYKGHFLINKMSYRLQYLEQFPVIPNNSHKHDNKQISKIIINNFNNKVPKLINNNIIHINSYDHILIIGPSGSGKTTFLYMLKNIIKIPKLNIVPDICTIACQAFITLPSHKNISNGYLYDIITNYSSNVDTELINFAIQKAELHNRIKTNVFINIEQFSSGEKIRILIARLIYIIIKNKYNILLFDEIDENLNDELALQICNTIQIIFINKIIFYISHHSSIKQLFNNHMYINDGIIKYKQNII